MNFCLNFFNETLKGFEASERRANSEEKDATKYAAVSE